MQVFGLLHLTGVLAVLVYDGCNGTTVALDGFAVVTVLQICWFVRQGW